MCLPIPEASYYSNVTSILFNHADEQVFNNLSINLEMKYAIEANLMSKLPQLYQHNLEHNGYLKASSIMFNTTVII